MEGGIPICCLACIEGSDLYGGQTETEKNITPLGCQQDHII